MYFERNGNVSTRIVVVLVASAMTFFDGPTIFAAMRYLDVLLNGIDMLTCRISGGIDDVGGAGDRASLAPS
ncbi:hypothetical protein AVEN_67774-1, partial [Araneus ventricosus]